MVKDESSQIGQKVNKIDQIITRSIEKIASAGQDCIVNKRIVFKENIKIIKKKLIINKKNRVIQGKALEVS